MAVAYKAGQPGRDGLGGCQRRWELQVHFGGEPEVHCIALRCVVEFFIIFISYGVGLSVGLGKIGAGGASSSK
jgi:hypothetical protein